MKVQTLNIIGNIYLFLTISILSIATIFGITKSYANDNLSIPVCILIINITRSIYPLFRHNKNHKLIFVVIMGVLYVWLSACLAKDGCMAFYNKKNHVIYVMIITEYTNIIIVFWYNIILNIAEQKEYLNNENQANV